MLELGKAFENGSGVLADRKMAAQNYWRAGENGNAEGAYRYAVMLRSGNGVEQDMQAALKYFTRAVSLGYTSAQSDVDALVAQGIRLPAKPAVRRTAASQGKTKKVSPSTRKDNRQKATKKKSRNSKKTTHKKKR